MQGIKHLIECHCMLPQYKNRPDPVFHKFIVFSIIDDSDTVIPKYAQCNNCGIVHKIIDICKSEIITGKEELKSLPIIDDIRFSLSEDIQRILDSYNADLPSWEHVQFIIENKVKGSHVVLTSDIMEDEIQGKMLIFDDKGKIKIETFIYQNTVS